ncbi:MAG: hypothetical protein LBK82_08515, partial [Planctomycetaceae bacterium]|nr:hypothetical protein [Planctomycetaceae bacterium]
LLLKGCVGVSRLCPLFPDGNLTPTRKAIPFAVVKSGSQSASTSTRLFSERSPTFNENSTNNYQIINP